MKKIKERGIVMTGEHPAKVRSGEKTQTRRLIKQPPDGYVFKRNVGPWLEFENERDPNNEAPVDRQQRPLGKWSTRFRYQVGQRLYIQEVFAAAIEFDQMKPSDIPEGVAIAYKSADEIAGDGRSNKLRMSCRGKWRSSRFMPKKFARDRVDVLAIRVERLTLITEEDAKAEGMPNDHSTRYAAFEHCIENVYRRNFALTWDKLHSKHGHDFAQDEWVAVITFKLTRFGRTAGAKDPRCEQFEKHIAN